jgi:aspartate-semialdehyde dehydrogenase
MSGLRIGVVGATGALGSEVLAVLAASSLSVEELRLFATDRSLGHEIDFRDGSHPVEAGAPRLRGLDLLFLCTPAEVSVDLVREALRAEVTCIDVAGAMASSPEVPLRVAAFGAGSDARTAPLLVAPPGAALAWALVLRPLQAAAGLERVHGTTFEAASSGGRPGIESLYRESLAIFNQEEAPEPDVFSRPVAFDCIPALGEVREAGDTDREAVLTAAVGRLLGGDVKLAATRIQVPIFVGFGSVLAVETTRGLDAKQAAGALAATPGVELWEGDADGLTLRAAAGSDGALVGRLRGDPSAERGLLLWLSADLLRLAAANAVELAEARVRLHH